MSSSPLSIIVAQDRPSVLVQNEPQVIFVQYSARRGSDGADGADADFTDPDTVAAMLEALTAQITASKLHQDLLTRIDKIDLGPTSLESQQALLAYAQSQVDQEIAGYADRLLANENAVVDQQVLLTALGSDLSTLDGTVTGNAAVVQQLSTRVIATEDELISQASLIEGVGARIDVTDQNLIAQAGVVNQISADVSLIDGELTALSSSVTTLSSQVGTNTSAIQTTQTALATLDGEVSAEYTVKLNVNNKITGFGLFATLNEPSLFEIIADRFAITNQNNTGVIPFTVDGNNVYIKAAFIQDATITNAKIQSLDVAKLYAGTAKIANALIGDAQVNTLQIAGQAVTVPLSAYSLGRGLTGSASYVTYTYVQYPVDSYLAGTTLSVTVFASFTGLSNSGACLGAYRLKISNPSGSVIEYSPVGVCNHSTGGEAWADSNAIASPYSEYYWYRSITFRVVTTSGVTGNYGVDLEVMLASGHAFGCDSAMFNILGTKR